MLHHQPTIRQRRWTQPLMHAIIIVGAVVMVYPVFWLLTASFKPLNETFNNAGLFPKTWTLDNYVQGWSALDYTFDVFFGGQYKYKRVCLIRIWYVVTSGLMLNSAFGSAESE